MHSLLLLLVLLPFSFACRTGWFRFHESCYYFEREEKATFAGAMARCSQLGATLFVANSRTEFEYVMREQAPHNTWTWLGLEKHFEEEEALWQAPGAMHYYFLPWLVVPYTNAANGWSSAAQCAGHWNPTGAVGKYVYWYPCTYEFFYVCERNAFTDY